MEGVENTMIEYTANLTCPACGFTKQEDMPDNF
jgi:hypothetical protein